MKISYYQIEPIESHLAKVRLKTISGDEFSMLFTTVEDLKKFPDVVTVHQISSIEKLKKVM